MAGAGAVDPLGGGLEPGQVRREHRPHEERGEVEVGLAAGLHRRVRHQDGRDPDEGPPPPEGDPGDDEQGQQEREQELPADRPQGVVQEVRAGHHVEGGDDLPPVELGEAVYVHPRARVPVDLGHQHHEQDGEQDRARERHPEPEHPRHVVGEPVVVDPAHRGQRHHEAAQDEEDDHGLLPGEEPVQRAVDGVPLGGARGGRRAEARVGGGDSRQHQAQVVHEHHERRHATQTVERGKTRGLRRGGRICHAETVPGASRPAGPDCGQRPSYRGSISSGVRARRWATCSTTTSRTRSPRSSWSTARTSTGRR